MCMYVCKVTCAGSTIPKIKEAVFLATVFMGSYHAAVSLKFFYCEKHLWTVFCNKKLCRYNGFIECLRVNWRKKLL